MPQITANLWNDLQTFRMVLPVLILAFVSDSKFSLLDIFHLSIETVLVGTTIYAIHFTKFKITSSVIPNSKSKPQPLFFTKTQVICKQGSDVSPLYANDLFKKVTCFK